MASMQQFKQKQMFNMTQYQRKRRIANASTMQMKCIVLGSTNVIHKAHARLKINIKSTLLDVNGNC